MSSTVIAVDQVSKGFALMERPSDRLHALLPWASPSTTPERTFWALRDISFQVAQGETLGIMGGNGAGKSTLLQILCGTMKATSGQVRRQGRIAGLLELGSGFEHTATGRENIFINALVLGLDARQVRARMDAIISFADIGDFIDRPVQLYSSGMVLRLAFAVVAHTEPNVLIVDEALAVGDQFFQAKCLERIRRMQALGTTLLFVSHDPGVVRALCSRALLLERGRLVMDGTPAAVAERYFARGVAGAQELDASPAAAPPAVAARWLDGAERFAAFAAFERQRNGMADILNVQLLDERGQLVEELPFRARVTLRLAIRANVPIAVLAHGYHIRDRNGYDLVYSDSAVEGAHLVACQPGVIQLVDWTFTAALNQGRYSVAVVCSIPIDLGRGQVTYCDFVPIAVQFTMRARRPEPIYGSLHWPNQVSARSVVA